MNILLTKRAERSYKAIREYIQQEWGDKVAEAFEQKIVDFLALLKSFPEMGSIAVADKKIYGFQVTKQTQVLYRIKGDHIIILTFFDVRQDPTKKFK
ncbi:type II toxin-antitoxin system RelE/ParE family toxin [Adhaeribacter pallidiroseus]|uniref:Plasmid stabilization system protein n=1 Tax=Adhaeribacter pallidiroseus TaxID=2072847 RepID=A0A369QIZ8_9BACT|nr:type II toxin-antitoxin system RelE/ParE family toxin [Adhaeribacter pallidiroseus]RDC64372.1 hypothetical protein AHMF7616_02985 [Adhaeribacter pallidiroseus]